MRIEKHGLLHTAAWLIMLILIFVTGCAVACAAALETETAAEADANTVPITAGTGQPAVENKENSTETVEEKFAAICNDVEDAQFLERFLDPVWVFTYDSQKGLGRIDYTMEGIKLGETAIGSSFIDFLSLSVRFFIDVRKGERNIVSLAPVLEISTIGEYRPFIKGAALVHAGWEADLKQTGVQGGIEGDYNTEIVTFLPEGEEMVKLMLDPGSSEPWILQIEGLYQDYGMDISDAIPQLTEAMQAYFGLNG